MNIIHSKEVVEQRIRELGKEISSVYQGKPLTLLIVMNGGLFFGAKLAESITLDDFYIDSIPASSYVNDTSSGEVILRSKMKLDVKGRNILILDEVLDSGRTLKRIMQQLLNLGAESVRTVVLAEKTIPRPDGIEHADWSGFLVDDRYLIGCGMDSHEKYRNLPFIGYL